MTDASRPRSTSDLHAELEKVLALEARLGYTDRAVVGGLDTYVRRWFQRLLTAGGVAADVQGTPYRQLDPQGRRHFVQELRGIRDDLGVSAVPPPESQIQDPKSKITETPETQNPRSATAIASLKGVNAATALRLRRLGLHTLGDLLTHYPRRYVEYRPSMVSTLLQDGGEITLRATLLAIRETRLGQRMSGAEATVQAEDARWRVVWFNQAYLARQLKPGTALWLHGKVGSFQGRPVIESPDFE
ncbi:MAG: hypothetical protein HYY05_06720, partial [Chloroflexi bacterium]|nr:hypothetical protein [Chloroflexota bacterium]